MRSQEPNARILVCETYPGMREAFALTLGEHYELDLAEDISEILPLLRQHPVRMLIWDIDPPTGSLQEAFETISSGSPVAISAKESRVADALETLKAIRLAHPDLNVLLISGEFDVDFQITAIRQAGLVGFETKPWKSAAYLLERVQVALGDKRSSIRSRVLRIPLQGPGGNDHADH